MNRVTKAALVVLGIAVAAAPFWVALTIPFEEFETPKSPAASASVLTDLARWDAATPASRRAAAEDVARRLPDFALLRLETFSCGGQTHEVAIYAHAKTGMEFVLVPGGTFQMGSPESEKERDLEEPEHRVTLTRSYLLSRTECTEAAWDRVGGNDERRWHDPALPIENVSWTDVETWCEKAGLELPTEAQWEFACRAGTTTRWCTGDDASKLAVVAWYDSDPDYPMQKVAQKLPNACGLFDMHGNVWEWCWDRRGDYPSGSVTDPRGPEDRDLYRVMRGGIRYEYRDGGTPARSALRAEFPGEPGNHGDQIGFRPAKTVPME